VSVAVGSLVLGLLSALALGTFPVLAVWRSTPSRRPRLVALGLAAGVAAAAAAWWSMFGVGLDARDGVAEPPGRHPAGELVALWGVALCTALLWLLALGAAARALVRRRGRESSPPGRMES
jgi:hypothetical protein